MGQTARRLTPEVSARQRFGAELRRRRLARGLSQDSLGRLVHVSGDLLAKLEKAQRWPAHDVAARCDAILQAGGALMQMLPAVDTERARQGMAHADNAMQFAHPALVGADGRHTISLPEGPLFAATSIDAWLVPEARPVGSSMRVQQPTYGCVRPGDLFVVNGHGAFYATEARRRRQPDGYLTIPQAYVVDDFSVALLWATRALDDALHEDDQPLAEGLDHLRRLKPGRSSANAVSDKLTDTGQGWLGSYACASFIDAHLHAVGGPPSFWTREQRGQEAATWLLFSHKFNYLRTLRNRFGGATTTSMVRVFCIPDPALGPRSERVLLLLAAALMESMGVAVHVCGEPDYTDVEGFVLSPTGGVIVANWLRAGRVWHGDVVDSGAQVTRYREAIGFGVTRSLIAADTAAGRLRNLAEYTDVDWRWLTVRAAQIASAGVEGFVRPRSRLLGSAGIQAACEFLAQQRPPAS